jgi:hypothetical protein
MLFQYVRVWEVARLVADRAGRWAAYWFQFSVTAFDGRNRDLGVEILSISPVAMLKLPKD